MPKLDTDILGNDIEFPALPSEQVPENLAALTRIIAGQRALRLFYATLERDLAGEPRTICGLLARDCRNRFSDLLSSGEALVRMLGGEDREECLPSPSQIEKVAGRLARVAAGKVVLAARSFASRTLICTRMTPWVSDTQEVFSHFQQCLEAEDGHLAVVDIFSALVE